MIKYQGLNTLEVLEGAENYNNWIISQFMPFLKSPILEIGSGTGNISRFFIKKRDVYLSDIDAGLIKHLKQKFPHKKRTIIKYNVEQDQPKRFYNFFNTVIGINVLEHIKNDKKTLRNIYSLLKPNGNLLLLVPAKMFAYTELDKKLGHYRRYEQHELREKIEKAGFIIEELYSFNFVGLISWMVRDKIERGNHLKTYQVALFDKIVPTLKIIENMIKPVVGVSFIVKATKK